MKKIYLRKKSIKLNAVSIAILFFFLLIALTKTSHAQISITSTGTPFSENFNTLASSGTSSTVPPGWAFAESGTSASNNGLYTAGTGSGTAGDTYSFGSTASSERAFGGLFSNTFATIIGANYINNTGGAINTISISYTGEQWRLGATGRVDRLDFQYSTDATSLTTGTWTDVNTLDFTAPVTVGTVGLLDGNLAANKTAISASYSGFTVANVGTFWIRWNDFNASGSDDGLSVDDFSLTATFCVAPSISSVTSSSPVCSDGTLSLNVVAAGDPTLTYLWSGPGTYSPSNTVSNPSVTGGSSSNYTVTVSNSCGSTSSSTSVLEINPSVNAGSNVTICQGGSTQLNATCEIFTITATLSGANEVPPNASPGTGTATGYYNSATNVFDVSVIYSGLTSNSSAGHFHKAPVGNPGGVGGVIVDFPSTIGLTLGAASGGGTGSTSADPLSAAEETALFVGEIYANIHSVAFGGGEIRGPLTATCGITSYSWSPATGLDNPNIANPLASPASTTIYTVTSTGPGGCTATSSVTVTVTPLTTSNAGPDQSLCNVTTATLAANTAIDGTGIWTVQAGGGTVTTPGDPNSGVTGLTTGTNTFRWTITNGSCSSANDVTIVVHTAAPAQPGAISGPTTACPPQLGQIYSISPVSNADVYSWFTGPGTTGVTFVGPTDETSVEVDFGTTVNSTYSIRVIAVNACGAGPFRSFLIRRTVSVPFLSGSNMACPNDVKTYTVPAPVSGAVGYTFYAPAGASITDGVNTGNPLFTTLLSADVTFPAVFTQGSVCVTAMGPCEETAQRCITVKAIPAQPASISGTSQVCPSDPSEIYTTPAVSGLTYSWSVSSPNMSVNSAAGNSADIAFNSSFTNGSICVTASNTCNVSPQRCKNLSSALPGMPGAMSGPITGVCGTEQPYSVPPVSGMAYVWSATNSATVTPTTNTALVDFTTAVAFPVKICVTATNACGTSAARCVSVKGVPGGAPSITGSAAPCAGVPESYSIATLFGATTYKWQAPSGAVINDGFTSGNPLTTTANSVTITFVTGSGNVTVTGKNSCGSGSAKSKAVTVTCRQSGDLAAQTFKMAVFPNPAHDMLTVSFESTVAENGELIITDLSGREILQQSVTAKARENQVEMDISKLAKGMYLLNLRSQNNNGQLPIVIE